ncbi:CynX/NimT family MFS transporter [Staphylococcus cornubiensis]|uniref:CynX/NimT family MFS transporter n=1 Tax=Staphylococcus cornubiensis TaxID=1986155 RepID=UPI000A3A6997|nr:MFS transporter [Staphylococcus cornubiensis]
MSELNRHNRIQDQWLLVFGIILIAATLRAPLTSVGPVIQQIKTDLHINNGIAGLITTIPLIIFGIVSPFVSRMLSKISMSRFLFLTLILTIVALVIRVMGGVSTFFMGTVLLGVSIALANVTLPAYAKWAFPTQIGLITGIYSATMNFTAGLGGGLSYPLSTVTSLSYRFSLVFWVIFAVVALVIWLPQLKQLSHLPSQQHDGLRKPIYRSKIAWAVALTMAFQSMMFYSIVAWYPSILVSKGVNPEMAGYFLMLNQFAQLPMTFTFPIIAAKMSTQRSLIGIVAALMSVGFTLLFFDNTWLLLVAMVLTGMGIGACFSLCMTMFSIRSKTTAGSMALSGFGQSIGYWVAAIGPFMLGLAHDILSNWTIAIILFLLMVVGVLIAGMIAAQNKYIEDE